MDEIQFNYQAPQLLDKNLWHLTGEWKNKLGRRMTIVRLQDGRVWIHNAFRLKEKDLAWLKALGDVAFIVAPNTFHCSDAGWMAQQFPQAELFVPLTKIPSFQSLGLKPKDANADFPFSISNELRCFPMQGTRMSEAVFIHIPTKTLILCDLAFNMPDVFSGFEKIIMNWNKVGGGRFGPSRLTQLLFAKDKQALKESYQQILNENFDRVIVNHGNILERYGKEKLQKSVTEIFGS